MQTIEQTAAPAAATPTAPAKPIRKVSFGKVPKKKEETKTAYPVFDDPATGDQVKAIAARIKKRAEEMEALDGAQETDKAELKMFVAPFYYRTNAGKLNPPSSIAIPSSEGEVLVTFQNRYKKLESEAPLVPILGDAIGDYVRQSFNITIKGDDLPAGKEQEIVDAVTELLEKHGAAVAMEVQEALMPVPTFHVTRLSKFTPEQNLAIDRIWPVVAMVKTKGRGK
ncbi:MAG TPA: hypothetical protein GYA07_12780 [Verrucomicrobia bacterium]|nr:hypothetical protein [Verrucomicrobiota bacterium]HOP98949.1 hypothetical protein [Verrucomicrobiota bacterium]HPU54969.1 hypothetical protein [Verrucomicrobiota bacterium]